MKKERNKVKQNKKEKERKKYIYEKGNKDKKINKVKQNKKK